MSTAQAYRAPPGPPEPGNQKSRAGPERARTGVDPGSSADARRIASAALMPCAGLVAAGGEIAAGEQPSFWDVRARHRLVINYDEVSEELGYEIDGYAIQHEMSTHYGRMIATDDALMLFSDPTEVMEYLMR